MTPVTTPQRRHLQGTVHWTAPLLGLLAGDVRLAGSSISCQPTPLDGDQDSVWRRNPHVQSYALATNQAGSLAGCLLSPAPASLPGP